VLYGEEEESIGLDVWYRGAYATKWGISGTKPVLGADGFNQDEALLDELRTFKVMKPYSKTQASILFDVFHKSNIEVGIRNPILLLHITESTLNKGLV